MGIASFPVGNVGINVKNKTKSITQLSTSSVTLVTLKEVASGSGYFDLNLSVTENSIGDINFNVQITIDGSVLLTDSKFAGTNRDHVGGGFHVSKIPYTSSYKVELKNSSTDGTITGIVVDYAD